MLTAILLLDIDLANSGMLPGGAAIAVIGWAGLVVAAVALLAAAGAWSPGARLARCAARACRRRCAPTSAAPSSSRRPPASSASSTWMLVPLIVPALGCAALAVVAIPERRRAR